MPKQQKPIDDLIVCLRYQN